MNVFCICERFRDEITFVAVYAKKKQKSQWLKWDLICFVLEHWFYFFLMEKHKYHFITKLCTYLEYLHIFVIQVFHKKIDMSYYFFEFLKWTGSYKLGSQNCIPYIGWWLCFVSHGDGDVKRIIWTYVMNMWLNWLCDIAIMLLVLSCRKSNPMCSFFP